MWNSICLNMAIVIAGVIIGGGLSVEAQRDRNPISPARQINHPPNRSRLPRPSDAVLSIRSIDGSGNNLTALEMGAANTPLLRLMGVDYADGVSALAGPNRPSPRAISNAINVQDQLQPNPLGASDFLWQWGQFVDHDIDLTDGTDPAELANIPVPPGDAWFDPQNAGDVVMTFNRSIYDPATGITRNNPREQVNEITAWIDASNVYGSSPERSAALRTLDGTGRLHTSAGNLLPFNTNGLPNAGGDSDTLFLAGDVRANEQVGLTAMHTLFVREHNRLATELAASNPELTGDEVYQQARSIIIAEMQVITYQEFIPALLGPGALPPYQGYNPNVDARIANVFSTAAYRFGHSALSPTLLRLDANGDPIAAGHLALRDAFFTPGRLIEEGGIEPLLRGLARQRCQRVDPYVVDEVRNFLFGAPGAGGFDLAALNIQRGRDHGLPSYNETRAVMGLPQAQSFADMTPDAAIQTRLAAIYDTVDAIDVWVGALAERPRSGAHVGELSYTILKEQFEMLRDGDRFWYTRVLSPQDRAMVERSRLADIIRRNTTIGDELQDDVFRVPITGGRRG